MYRIFLHIHRFFKHHELAGVGLLLLFLVFSGFFTSRLSLEEDITRLIPSGERHDILRRVLEETKFSDKIIVRISDTGAVGPDRLTRYGRQYIDSLEKGFGGYVREIQGKIPEENVLEVYDFVYDHLPIFLNSKDYERIRQRTRPDSIGGRIRSAYKNLIAPTGLVTKEFIFKDPLSLTNLGLEKLRELQVGEDFSLHNDFIITRDKKHVLLFLSPVYPASETAENAVLKEKLDKLHADLNREFSGVEGGYFGGFLYSLANAERIKKDIRLSLGIAFLILLGLLIFFFRSWLVPLILFFPSLLGGLLALAILYFLKGEVSAISLGIGAVLLGISLDYALHILTHFRNHRNVEKLYRDLTRPVLMSSITTAMAFLCLLFIRSEALRDLGLFAAISMIAASGFALILIPLLYKPPENHKKSLTFIDRMANRRFYRYDPLVWIMLVLLVLGCFFFYRVDFDHDISRLNFEPREVKTAEEKTLEAAGRTSKSVFLVSYAQELDQALFTNNRLYQELKNYQDQGEIRNFSSIGGVVLSTATQQERIRAWEEYWNPDTISRLRRTLIDTSGKYGFRPESFQYFYGLLKRDFQEIILEDYHRTSGLYLDDFISQSSDFATVTTTVNLQEEQTGILSELEKEEGIVAIDRRQISERFLGSLRNNFNRLILFSLGGVFLVLLLFYRSLELSLLTLLPIAGTWIISLGLLALLGIEFNVLNIIISTFVFGLGLDYSIFITNAGLKEYERGEDILPTYQASILLSGLTTLLGIGALFFARHPALRSISVVSLIGVTTALLVAFVLQTKLIELIFLRRKARSLPPLSFSGLLHRQKSEERLYRQKALMDNFRFKPHHSEVYRIFSREKERFLKVAGFIEAQDRVAIFNSDYGMLPLFLHLKEPQVRITTYEPDGEKLRLARNTLAGTKNSIKFTPDLSHALEAANVLILQGSLDSDQEAAFRKLIPVQVKKVILLSSDYSFRWILDHDFEIIYRQNQILFLQNLHR